MCQIKIVRKLASHFIMLCHNLPHPTPMVVSTKGSTIIFVIKFNKWLIKKISSTSTLIAVAVCHITLSNGEHFQNDG